MREKADVGRVQRSVNVSYPIVLGTLAFLFCLRVAGQALVYFLGIGFLPPMERWHSGLLPYPVLLTAQIALIAILLKIVWDVSRGAGFFADLQPRTGRILKILAYVYASAMVVRYAVTMILHPEYLWFTGTIPIWFHFVLAAFLFTLGKFNADRAAKAFAERAP
jgi:hypothetical protein